MVQRWLGQLVDILLLGWWWGKEKSISSAFRSSWSGVYMLVGSISSLIINFSHLEWASVSAKYLKDPVVFIPWPGLLMWLSGKESPCQAGDLGSILGLRRSSWKGNGNPLLYSCLGNPMDRAAPRATVHGVAKSWTWLSNWRTTIPWWGNRTLLQGCTWLFSPWFCIPSLP